MLADVWREALSVGPWPLDFRDPRAAAATIVRRAARHPIDGIIATDETTSVIATMAADMLGLAHNPIDAARAAADKLMFRSRLHAADVRQPQFVEVATGLDETRLRAACAAVAFPVVIKPKHLSASRGVMRADGPDQLWKRYQRLCALLASPDVRGPNPAAAETVIVEQFVAGEEFAFEGLLVGGALRRIALFDKPDPLDGPFFTETIYVTPSGLPEEQQRAVFDAVAEAAAAIGLTEGPVHAELRLSADGPVVLELAARSIGGLCSRTLRYGAGVSLEELVIAHALGRSGDIEGYGGQASGVMMLPVPSEGVLMSIDGLDRAMQAERIRDIAITARVGDTVAPLPEGNTYMGFVFATAETAAAVIDALRVAAEALRFRIAPRL